MFSEEIHLELSNDLELQFKTMTNDHRHYIIVMDSSLDGDGRRLSMVRFRTFSVS